MMETTLKVLRSPNENHGEMLQLCRTIGDIITWRSVMPLLLYSVRAYNEFIVQMHNYRTDQLSPRSYRTTLKHGVLLFTYHMYV